VIVKVADGSSGDHKHPDIVPAPGTPT